MEDNTKNDIVEKLIAALRNAISEADEVTQEQPDQAERCTEGEIESNIRTMARGIVTALRMIAKTDEDIAETLAEEVAEVIYNYDLWEPAETIWPTMPDSDEADEEACSDNEDEEGTPHVEETIAPHEVAEYVESVVNTLRQFTSDLDMAIEHDRKAAEARTSLLEFALRSELDEIRRAPALGALLTAVKGLGVKYSIDKIGLVRMVEQAAGILKQEPKPE